MLREFWFPLFLTLAGTLTGVAGSYADGITRKWWWTLTAAIWFAAGLSYIWGDPVRGPFYLLTHQRANNTFSFHAGGTSIHPVSELSKGIDFERMLSIGGGTPIKLTVSRTWWAGLKYDGAVLVAPGQWVSFNNNSIHPLPSGWDYNNDGYAVEIVDATMQPIFQLVQASDNDVYVNAMISTGKGQIMVLNGNSMHIDTNPSPQWVAEKRLSAIFKYPRYVNQGVRR